ncbi:hypothetical protein N480_06690 [Pseudoalteromonas luteoviolacea S2607]|nr:hypothetical protein N480_06690 [Pseudoalteromonas luteoviolacea S2607]
MVYADSNINGIWFVDESGLEPKLPCVDMPKNRDTEKQARDPYFYKLG